MKTTRGMLSLVLERGGYDVCEACDGKEALGLVGEKDFDLIVTDINMPVMGGVEFIGEFRRDERNRTTPIIVLTTETDDELKKVAGEAGASGWLVKPCDPDKLLQGMKKLLG